MGLYSKLAGGYRGDKDGYKIPAGTDIFLSVSRKHLYPFYLCALYWHLELVLNVMLKWNLTLSARRLLLYTHTN